MTQPAPQTDLHKALHACRSSFIAVGVFSLFINLLMLVPSFFMLQLYDRVLSSGSRPTLLMLTLLLILLLGTLGALEWVRSRIMVRTSTRLETLLAPRLFDVSFRQALYSGGTQASGQPLADLTGLRQFLTGPGLFAFFDAPWLPVYLGVMFLFHPLYGWFGVLCAIVLGLLALANERLTRQPLQDANKENLAATSFTSKSLRNAEVVASMGMLPQLMARWQGMNHKVLRLQSDASDLAGTMSSASRTLRLLVQSLILAIGAWLVLEQEITPGLMIAGSILLGRALAPIDQMIGVWKGFTTARQQYARLNELLGKIPPEPERMPLPPPVGAISVDNLVVVPPGAREPVLRGVSFKVAAGESVGIIGPSGAGKSSLARALLGLWPGRQGCVRLDGADIASLPRDTLGPHIGYLPQDIELFEGSISENIARFGEVNPGEVVAAAQLTSLHELILQLPEGYDTRIGASGGVLSGGQRQRVGLARAVYGRPKLIILDEPNSNLDDIGERALAQALQQIKAAGSTLFVISHRPSVLASVDRLLVLSEGSVALFGPRDQVLARLQQGAQPAQTPAIRS
jgi:ATP-binding cassette subfamily C protein EexD